MAILSPIYCRYTAHPPIALKERESGDLKENRKKKYRRKVLLVPPLLSGGGVLGHQCFFAGR